MQCVIMSVTTEEENVLYYNRHEYISAMAFYSFAGWRIRKKYFAVKDTTNPKQKYLLSWVSVISMLV